jgi:hypothetical protein
MHMHMPMPFIEHKQSLLYYLDILLSTLTHTLTRA